MLKNQILTSINFLFNQASNYKELDKIWNQMQKTLQSVLRSAAKKLFEKKEIIEEKYLEFYSSGINRNKDKNFLLKHIYSSN